MNYELHMTVDPDRIDVVARFLRESPLWRGWKVLEFENYTRSGGLVARDAMTVAKFYRVDEALKDAKTFANDLAHSVGINVVRTKIEGHADAREEALYYETHLMVGGSVAETLQFVDVLYSRSRRRCDYFTVRTRGVLAMHDKMVSETIKGMLAWGTQVLGHAHVEKIVYDDNPLHDEKWETA